MFCFQLDHDVQDELRRAQDPVTMGNVSGKVSVNPVKGENQDSGETITDGNIRDPMGEIVVTMEGR